MRKPSHRAGAIEGLVFRFSHERPVPAPEPFLATYTGEGIESVEGIGLFQSGTTAEVSAEVAEALRGREGFVVAPHPAEPNDDEGDDA